MFCVCEVKRKVSSVELNENGYILKSGVDGYMIEMKVKL